MDSAIFSISKYETGVCVLKSQEIYILVALANRESSEWTYDRLASSLGMSPSQVFKSLERAEFANLFVKEKRRVIRRNLLEFLVHGIRYAFPTRPGRMARGIPAGWQAPRLSELMLESSETYVWPSSSGSLRGQSIEPLHDSLPSVASGDASLHGLFALIDIVRVGSARERKVASAELEQRLG